MAAYLIAAHKIVDPEQFVAYLRQVAPLITEFGGRYLTRPGSHMILEHSLGQPDRAVILEFPDMAALNAFYNSPEYQPIFALRQGATLDLVISVEGA